MPSHLSSPCWPVDYTSIIRREKHGQRTKKQYRSQEEINHDTKRKEDRDDTQERGAEVQGSWAITRIAGSTADNHIRNYTNEAYVIPGHIGANFKILATSSYN